jgi:hypothetical protein
MASQCPGNHAMKDYILDKQPDHARSALRCDGCRSTIEEGAVVRCCPECDYDLCGACMTGVSRRAGASPRIIAQQTKVC